MHKRAMSVVTMSKGGKGNTNRVCRHRILQESCVSLQQHLNKLATVKAVKIIIRCIIFPPSLAVRLECVWRSLVFAHLSLHQGYLQKQRPHQGCLPPEIAVTVHVL